ncbi:MAG: peptidylprolyl isomerase [Cytophagales bacterium]|nr:peptidylprolyl isomerase [Cytophagales bacterium]
MKQKLIGLSLMMGVMLMSISCSNNEAPNESEDYLITISTPEGDMKAILFDETPLHKKNFIELAKAGKYDGNIWHRVIEGFMIQGGDIYRGTEEQEPADGKIPAEIIPGFFHKKGAIAAARQGDQINPKKMSSSCQFYVVQGSPYEELTCDQFTLNNKMSELLGRPEFGDLLAEFQELAAKRDNRGMNQLALENRELVEEEFGIDLYKPLPPDADAAYKGTSGTPGLDGQYTVFGQVLEGFDVIDKIAAVNTVGPPTDTPVEDITLSVSVETVTKAEITEKYGYQYK